VKPNLTLKNAPTGEKLLIESLSGDCCQKLREFGFCEGLDVCKISEKQCILCSVCGIKYAISKELSARIILNENQYQDHDQSCEEE